MSTESVDKIPFAAPYRCCQNQRMLQTAERGASTSKTRAREIPRGVPHHAPDADFQREARQSLPGRSNHRRRLHRRARSGQRGVRIFLQVRRCFAPLIRDQAGALLSANISRCGAHLSWLATRPDARARREYPSRLSEDGAARDDQPSRRDGFRRRRQVDGEADEGRERVYWPDDNRRRRHADRGDA